MKQINYSIMGNASRAALLTVGRIRRQNQAPDFAAIEAENQRVLGQLGPVDAVEAPECLMTFWYHLLDDEER
ncbi:hypothetical protein GAY31_20070 [Azospirillum brasilense]|nr:hypothetical protein [Azospirillum brasilense]